MARSPMVIHVEADDSWYDGGNPDREDLIYILQVDHNCQVLSYDNEYYLFGDQEKIKRYIACSMIILVIIKQERYSEFI